MSPNTFHCMHRAPNSVAFRTPSQLSAGCGSFHRNAPTGGAAKGIPLKICTFPSALVVPSTTPEAVFTLFAAATSIPLSSATKTNAPTARRILIASILMKIPMNSPPCFASLSSNSAKIVPPLSQLNQFLTFKSFLHVRAAIRAPLRSSSPASTLACSQIQDSPLLSPEPCSPMP